MYFLFNFVQLKTVVITFFWQIKIAHEAYLLKYDALFSLNYPSIEGGEIILIFYCNSPLCRIYWQALKYAGEVIKGLI